MKITIELYDEFKIVGKIGDLPFWVDFHGDPGQVQSVMLDISDFKKHREYLGMYVSLCEMVKEHGINYAVNFFRDEK